MEWTDEGAQRKMAMQVTEAIKALIIVSRIVKAANNIILDEDGSYIEDRTTGD